MTSLAKTAGESGALYTISGTIPINATWYEDIFFRDENGDPYTLTGNTFKLTLREDAEDDSAVLTLSTSDSLSIQVDSDSGASCLLRINASTTTLSALDARDYVADLAMKNTSTERVTHLAHGILTARKNPVSFD